MNRTLQKIFSYAAENNVSDIHLREGDPPVLRLKGDLASIKAQPLTRVDLEEICKSIIKDTSVHEQLDKIQELDGAFEAPGVARFRYNVFRYSGKLGVILRLIPVKIKTIDELKFAPVIKTITEAQRGLILVTGATGSGKSTTLAAMIDHLNAISALHIVTIEDPIEFVHTQKKARITQREIGGDTLSFGVGLRSVLRQDPDVILIGEIRDRETMDIALKAAETGHVVFSTMHTTDAMKTISRLVSLFPPEEQAVVRIRLSEVLKATVAQRMLSKADKTGLVVAQEIMINNAAIQECIADPNRLHEMNKFIENGYTSTGSQTFDQHLVYLLLKKQITMETAKEASLNSSDFERNLLYSKESESRTTLSTNSNAEQPEIALDQPEIALDQPRVTLEKQAPKVKGK